LEIGKLENFPWEGSHLLVRWKHERWTQISGRTSLSKVDSRFSALWNEKLDIAHECSMNVDPDSNELQSSFLRFWVVEQGKTSSKLKPVGTMKIDLSRCADNFRHVEKHLLMESKLNCTLTVSIFLKQVYGSPLFRRPSQYDLLLDGEDPVSESIHNSSVLDPPLLSKLLNDNSIFSWQRGRRSSETWTPASKKDLEISDSNSKNHRRYQTEPAISCRKGHSSMSIFDLVDQIMGEEEQNIIVENQVDQKLQNHSIQHQQAMHYSLSRH
jgi:hypothetical protein